MNCARSVIELITLYWPQSIDILQPERASVDGFRPIFFSSQGNVILFLTSLSLYHANDVLCVQDDFERSFFGDGQEPVDFGADQCKCTVPPCLHKIYLPG